jgi:hypothetical protein
MTTKVPPMMIDRDLETAVLDATLFPLQIDQTPSFSI